MNTELSNSNEWAFVSPASFQGIKNTKMADGKHCRHIIFLIERGKVFAGSSLSPAAIPTSPVPWKE